MSLPNNFLLISIPSISTNQDISIKSVSQLFVIRPLIKLITVNSNLRHTRKPPAIIPTQQLDLYPVHLCTVFVAFKSIY